MRTAKTLIRLGAQPHCWFCHEAALIRGGLQSLIVAVPGDFFILMAPTLRKLVGHIAFGLCMHRVYITLFSSPEPLAHL